MHGLSFGASHLGAMAALAALAPDAARGAGAGHLRLAGRLDDGRATIASGSIYREAGAAVFAAMAPLGRHRLRADAGRRSACMTGSAPEGRRGRVDEAALVARPGSRSLARRSGPSRSTKRARGASTRAGAMASDVPTMQPIISEKPARLGRVGEGQRLGEAAGLVELDVDGVVEPDEPVEARAVVHALVGADRNRAGDAAAENASALAGKRLLDEGDSRPRRRRRSARRGSLRSSPRWRRRSGSRPARPGGRRGSARGRRPAPPSLTFRIGRSAALAAASAMRFGRVRG